MPQFDIATFSEQIFWLFVIFWHPVFPDVENRVAEGWRSSGTPSQDH